MNEEPAGLDTGKIKRYIREMMDNMDKARKLTDKELMDIILDDVWGGMKMTSMESALVGEMMRRFDIMMQNRKDVNAD